MTNYKTNETPSRKELEDLETTGLAPYASKSADTLGRKHADPPHPLRSCFARDRDRIFHSRCFRRLEYKTQVFVNGTADHFRTRLTHTMEMSAVGRTLARILNANEDLTESICLAHDLGHSPFGHEGEKVLDDLMKNEGGFDHNLQSLRNIEVVESPYPGFRGLNLTWEVRAGLLKHEAHSAGAALDGHPIGPFQSLEAQIADLADDMTYHAHDVDDGLEAGIVTLAQLETTEFWQRAAAETKARYANLSEFQFLRATIRTMLELQVVDVVNHANRALDEFNPQSMRDVMSAPRRIVDFGAEMKSILGEFSAFMFENLYYHQGVTEATKQSVAMMRKLFLHYIGHPATMGNKAQERIETEGLWRTVCDYVAGCTDRYAIEEYQKYGLGA
ncbi:Deoxyguanosinetriphosphate triphosphohydrolase-like protein [Pontiella desulfatans]|uniref:Deoxyguanosinetriphosphate triphosphohydrolase-like protein n=1 Tax=Pontiella desulfatans TaxID=2750659 RepID=A0A6C2U4K9_PONDE|nr:deoxyguanosinetriphosphate triphosphohydrolase [Pontiella desulfatans]VGO14336.1 Deoxyguanosinetriphosphate triphosphohydrolase-like protein [Pontiella desulfatans]